MATTMDEGQSSTTTAAKAHMAQDARFSCNICLDPVSEPVVTRCGHLYCWPCLYKWLAPGMTPRERASLGMPRSAAPLHESRRVCPVCKSECSVPTVVPIYVRNNDHDGAPKEPQSRIPSEFQSIDHLNNNHHQEQDDANMGLDIDDDMDDDDMDLGLDIDDNPPAIPATVTTDNGINNLGLRQRRRSGDELNNTAVVVPTRPVPSRDRASTAETSLSSNNTSNNTNGAMVRAHSPENGPTPNHHARATLSYGLVLAMHQTLLHATNSAEDNNSNNEETIPSLHYPQQRRDSSNLDAEPSDWDQDPASTVFLSRLLFGLSLFVLFCLLSF